jgi:hypothetical protein
LWGRSEEGQSVVGSWGLADSLQSTAYSLAGERGSNDEEEASSDQENFALPEEAKKQGSKERIFGCE